MQRLKVVTLEIHVNQHSQQDCQNSQEEKQPDTHQQMNR